MESPFKLVSKGVWSVIGRVTVLKKNTHFLKKKVFVERFEKMSFVERFILNQLSVCVFAAASVPFSQEAPHDGGAQASLDTQEC